MSENASCSLLDRAKKFVAESARYRAAAVLSVVPLSAAAPAQAGYLNQWNYSFAGYDSAQTDPGTVLHRIQREQLTGGTRAFGTATYTLNKSAIGKISAGYSGLGSSVDAGDRSRFAWSFELLDAGAAPIDRIEWSLLGFYDSMSGPLTRLTLASGEGFGSYIGQSDLVFPTTMSDITWFGADLEITATVAGTEPGQYVYEVDLSNLQYTYIPIPEPSMVGVTVIMAGMLLRRRA